MPLPGAALRGVLFDSASLGRVMPMKNFFACYAVVFLGLAIAGHSLAVEPAAKPTHLLQPMIIEVAAAKPDGKPWDSGGGVFERPDLQVTLMRDDAEGIKQAIELLVQVNERKIKALGGRPPSPAYRQLMAGQAQQTLQYGSYIEALKDQALIDARSKFAADTKVANDSLIARLVDGQLPVSIGDKIAIYVIDLDLAAHDRMGQTELVITKELIAKGEAELKFNSVESLHLKLVPIAK